ncbi:hypothetical protein [Thalassotalea euphylliae]|uniref:hypothetical protein n=1 Tax=Thalassotalea euphylliae TaxID=1655234 RepID=UPI0011C0716A|nr:hypothetical protein [Thalassotalea euphylliae]
MERPNVFINVWALAFNILTLLSLSFMTCGFTPTLQSIATISWFVKEPKQIKQANQHLPVLRRLIIYSYTSGVFWTITDIVEASYYSFNGENAPGYVYEIGLASISILYAVLIAELIFRPLKNRQYNTPIVIRLCCFNTADRLAWFKLGETYPALLFSC